MAFANDVKLEYNRLADLYKDIDPQRRALLDGPLLEYAKIRVQLQQLNEVAFNSGLVLVDPNNPLHQKELPVSRALSKLRQSYIAYTQRIKSLADVDTEDDDDGLDDYV